MNILLKNIENNIKAPIYILYNKVVENVFNRDDLTLCVPVKNWIRKKKNGSFYVKINGNVYNYTP